MSISKKFLLISIIFSILMVGCAQTLNVLAAPPSGSTTGNGDGVITVTPSSSNNGSITIDTNGFVAFPLHPLPLLSGGIGCSAANATAARGCLGAAETGPNNSITALTGLTTPLAGGYGGTGNAFMNFSGPATSLKTFTLPNVSSTILTSDAAVTVAQGGTGLGTLTANNVILGNGTSNPLFVAPGTSGNVLTSNGTTWTSAASAGGGGWTDAGTTISNTTLTDKVGIGDATPASLLTVGTGDAFQVNSSGDIVKIEGVDYNWPGSQGSAGSVLTINSLGGGTIANLTWGAAGGSGANTTLSNLASVAVNASLIPGADGAIDLGSPTLNIRNIYLDETTASTGAIYYGNTRFIHAYPNTTNFFAAVGAGNFTMTGTNNVGVGTSTLNSNTSGQLNIALGALALPSNTAGSRNVALGYQALYNNTTTSDNIAIGSGALFNNSTGGVENIGIGTGALASNISGPYNTAVGYHALNAVNNAIGNSTAIGAYALSTNTSGNNNTALGHEALEVNTSGSQNTALGRLAGNGIPGSGNITGSNNTYLGYNTGPSTSALSNTTVIGANATVTASNSIALGDSNVTAVSLGGGANIVYRCTSAGTLPVGALTISSGSCGAAADTGLRVR